MLLIFSPLQQILHGFQEKIQTFFIRVFRSESLDFYVELLYYYFEALPVSDSTSNCLLSSQKTVATLFPCTFF